MYADEASYTKDGVAQTPLKMPPKLIDGEPYLTVEGIKRNRMIAKIRKIEKRVGETTSN